MSQAKTAKPWAAIVLQSLALPAKISTKNKSVRDLGTLRSPSCRDCRTVERCGRQPVRRVSHFTAVAEGEGRPTCFRPGSSLHCPDLSSPCKGLALVGWTLAFRREASPDKTTLWVDWGGRASLARSGAARAPFPPGTGRPSCLSSKAKLLAVGGGPSITGTER